MSIDKHRVNAWSARKNAIDAHLDRYRHTEKPNVNVNAIVFWLVVALVASLFMYLRGYQDGGDDKTKYSVSLRQP